ncbi:unnamed protein product [Trichobilharzia regenti]|nr:unnamed protein product [Trichobilharzia regenti]
MTKGSQRSGYRERFMVSSNPYKLSECNRFRSTSSTNKLQDARQTRLCFTPLQEVPAMMNCESVSKFIDRLSAKSRSGSELCDDNGAVKKPVVASKPLLNRVSQNRVTASECSSDSKSLQSITSQSEDRKPLMICEEERKLSTSVIKEFEIDQVDQIDDGKLNICDNDDDTSQMSLVDHKEMRDRPDVLGVLFLYIRSCCIC